MASGPGDPVNAMFRKKQKWRIYLPARPLALGGPGVLKHGLQIAYQVSATHSTSSTRLLPIAPVTTCSSPSSSIILGTHWHANAYSILDSRAASVLPEPVERRPGAVSGFATKFSCFQSIPRCGQALQPLGPHCCSICYGQCSMLQLQSFCYRVSGVTRCG